MGQKTIVVVEDDPSMLCFLPIFLKSGFPDFRIFSTSNYESGLQFVRENFQDIAIAVLDESIVGGGCGSDIARIMITQGYTGLLVSISSQDLGEKSAFFNSQLKKPFRPRELVDVLKRIL